MDLQVETLDTHEARITIPIDDKTLAQARRDVAKRLGKQLRIPGFRPGMAPVAVGVSAVGQEAFANELVDELGKNLYPKAIDESKVEPYGPGTFEDFKTEPAQLVVRVPLEPTVDLKDYQNIRLPFPAVTVMDEDIEQQLQYVREENAIVELVDRPAELSDLVEADIEVSVDGKDVAHNHKPVVLDDEHMGIAGLAQTVAGVKAGEHKDATLTLPEDFGDETLRGKEAQVSIDVKRVSSRKLPEINDELAQTVGTFQTLPELREDLRKRLVDHRTIRAEQQYAGQVIDTFTNLSTVAYPPQFVQERLDDMMKELEDDVKRQERMPFDEWLKLQGKTAEQVREEMKPSAEMRAKRGLVMREVARAENVQVSDEEMAAEVQRTMAQFGDQPNNELRRILQSEENLRAVHNNILSNKVVQRMTEISRGEVPAVEPAADQPAAEQPAEQQATTQSGESAPEASA
jgi:trigger factor